MQKVLCEIASALLLPYALRIVFWMISAALRLFLCFLVLGLILEAFSSHSP
jgi:hypothetical protein